jgi:hypothetical protein
MMTKKHYIKIAALIRKQADRDDLNGYQDEMLHDLTTDLCAILKDDNPAFDKDRFMTACGF